MEGLAYLGFGIIAIGSLWFLFVAFTEGILWGLGCLFFSPIALVFLVLHWRVAKDPFFIQLAGFGVVILVGFLGGGDAVPF